MYRTLHRTRRPHRTPSLHRTAALLAVLTACLAAGATAPVHAATKATRKPATTKPATVAPATTTPARGKIVVGEASEVAGLDPAAVTTSITFASVVISIYDTLIDVPFGKDPQPELASALTEAADRKSWALTIRDGIKFHDGTPLTADAVKVNLERQRKSRLSGSSMALIKSIDVTGPLTLTMTLDKPYGSMPYLLGGTAGIMVSPKAIAEKADKLNREPTDAGTGPYILKEWVGGDHTTVVRNPNYWGTIKPRLDQITFKMVPDEAARYAALRAGDLQASATAFPNIVAQAKADGYAVVSPPIGGFAGILLNTSTAPFDDVRIRRAMAMARDRRAVSALFDDPNVDKSNDSLWPVGDPWYSADGDKLDYDRAGARALVSSYVKDTGNDASFTYTIGSAGGTLTDAARLQVRYWQDAGMDVKTQVLPDGNSVILSVTTGKFQAVGWIWGLQRDPDATAYPALHSSSPRNFGKYKSADMDAALEAGRAATDPAARKAAYAEVQRLFRKDVPFILQSPGTLNFIVDKKVCGIGTSGGFTAKTVGYGNC